MTMNARYKQQLEKYLIPAPQHFELSDGRSVISQKLICAIETADEEIQEDWIEELFNQYWGALPQIRIAQVSKSTFDSGTPESYQLKIDGKQISIRAADKCALRYALSTLRQLAEPSRSTAIVENYTLPHCEINDAPQIAFRGIHLCVFPETPVWTLEKQIRLAAYYKFNHVVLEFWGVFPFASHPEFAWQDVVWERKNVEHIRDVAQEVGITMIPQFNVFGHASMARSGTAKHAVLDFNPPLQSFFEPNGWCFCLTNPHTRQILTDLVEELHEFFGNPSYFHIGCDEAHGFASCSECARHSPTELVQNHVLWFHELLQKRGARAIMWHDMLVERGDERWNGWVSYGDENAAEILRQLPRDIVIADWQYYRITEDFPRDEPLPTAKYFSDEGFEVLLCPWKSTKNISRLAHEAEQRNLRGLLITTWHTAYAQTLQQIFTVAAQAGWRGGTFAAEHASALGFPLHLRQIGWDMKVTEYEQTGSSAYQILPATIQGIGN